jgi:hypothetical protein
VLHKSNPVERGLSVWVVWRGLCTAVLGFKIGAILSQALEEIKFLGKYFTQHGQLVDADKVGTH